VAMLTRPSSTPTMMVRALALLACLAGAVGFRPPSGSAQRRRAGCAAPVVAQRRRAGARAAPCLLANASPQYSQKVKLREEAERPFAKVRAILDPISRS
jgi:hypothetical protein